MSDSSTSRKVDLAALAKYDTATICNIIEMFNVRSHSSGYMNHKIVCCYEKLPPMVGYACTAMYRSASPPASDQVCYGIYDELELFAALPGPAVMVIQDLDEPIAGACFGELLCNAYNAFGGSGLVTSGAGRDLDQIEAIDFPVFVGSKICSHGCGHIPGIGIPVQVGGITIYQGDLLHGDRNGVTTIPLEIAADVVEIADEYVAAEGVLLKYLTKTKGPTISGYKDAHGEMVRLFGKIANRIKKDGDSGRDPNAIA